MNYTVSVIIKLAMIMYIVTLLPFNKILYIETEAIMKWRS